MTPFLPKITASPPGGTVPGLPADSKEALPGSELDKSVFYANAGKTKRPAPAKAKSAPSKEDLKNLLPFLGDQQVFGIYKDTYQKERNKQFLRITLALIAVRKYLDGEGEQAGTAKQYIANWLSDPALNNQDNQLSFHARKNLIWVLDRAKGDPGVAGILKALRNDYTEELKKNAQPKPKTRDEIRASMTNENMLGDQREAFAKEKNKKYLKVTLALIAVQEFLEGKADSLPFAKDKLVTWLKDGSLLRDPVALQVRKGMVRLLGVPAADAELGKQLQELVDLMMADYSSAPPPEEKKAAEEPKAEDNTPDEKKPEETKPPETKPEEPKAKNSVTVYFNPPKAPGKRGDNFMGMMGKIKGIFRTTYEKYLKSYADLSVSTTVNVKISNTSGAVTEVRFRDLQISGSAAPEAVEEMLREMAGRMYQVVSLEKQGSDPLVEVQIDGQKFQPPQ